MTKETWSKEKKAWCCEKKKIGCSKDENTPITLPPNFGSGINIPTIPTIPDEKCCMAMTPKCQSCALGLSEEEYCRRYPEMIGCTEMKGSEEVSVNAGCKSCMANCGNSKKNKKRGIDCTFKCRFKCNQPELNQDHVLMMASGEATKLSDTMYSVANELASAPSHLSHAGALRVLVTFATVQSLFAPGITIVIKPMVSVVRIRKSHHTDAALEKRHAYSKRMRYTVARPRQSEAFR